MSPQAAIIREYNEETGLDMTADELIEVYTDRDMEYSNGDQAHSLYGLCACHAGWSTEL